MIASLRRVLCVLTLLLALTASSPIPASTVPRYFQREPVTRREISPAQVQQELGATLSANATIIGPENPLFANLTHRWNTVAPPEIELVVQAGTESDIPKIVKYCNDNSFKFLAVNRGHGFSGALERFKGVQIDLKKLRSITIHPDGKSATLQGGTYAHDIIKTLWDAGYTTPTGSNECVGYLGPALGGGHGRLEGLHGLIADNMIHLNVVLADGSTIGVNETSHKDLWWAMRGAGHNFGIVISVDVKIYPILHPTWHWHNYIWTQDKLEVVLEALNKIQDNGNAPPLLGSTYGTVGLNKSISTTEAVLFWQFAYYGPAADAEALLQPFTSLDAIYSAQGDVSYPDIVIPQTTSLNECGAGKWALTHLLTQTWNTTTERSNYENFNKNAALYPEFAETAHMYYEGYATAGMKAVEPRSTAYAWRHDYHIALFMGLVPEGQSVPRALAWAEEVWESWTAGQPSRKPGTYVNYANGAKHETLESIYGYEKWRLQRLRKLKRKYDPYNRFRFYVPIVAGEGYA